MEVLIKKTTLLPGGYLHSVTAKMLLIKVDKY